MENDNNEGLRFLQELVNKEGIMVALAPKDINEDTYGEWLKTKVNVANGVNMPEGFIPCTTYWVVLDNKIICLDKTK